MEDHLRYHLSDDLYSSQRHDGWGIYERSSGAEVLRDATLEAAWARVCERVRAWQEPFFIELRIKIVARVILAARLPPDMVAFHERGRSDVWHTTIKLADYLLSLDFPRTERDWTPERVMYGG